MILLPITAALSLQRRSAAPAPPPDPGEGDPEIEVVLYARTGTLVAPEPVLFDAWATGADIDGVEYPAHELIFTFDFGDPSSGVFDTTGNSRNSYVGGPMAAHVYEQPGTYTVRCTAAHAGSGKSNWAEVTFTVADPDVVYAGTDTIVVSPTSNWTGAPSGAQQVTSLPTITSDKRILLMRGHGSSYGNISGYHNVHRVQVGAFGSGSNPIIGTFNPSVSTPPNINFCSEWKAIGLDITGSISDGPGMRGRMTHKCSQLTGGGIDSAGTQGYWADPGRLGGSLPMQERCFTSEHVLEGSTSNPFICIQGGMIRGAIIGCDIGGSEQHTMRVFLMREMAVQDNYLRGVSAEAIRHVIKQQGTGTGLTTGATWAESNNGALASAKLVFGRNRIGSAGNNNQWITMFAPEYGGAVGTVEDTIVEANDIWNNAGSNMDIGAFGRRVTIRGNRRAAGSSGAMRINTNFSSTYSNMVPEWDGPYFVYDN